MGAGIGAVCPGPSGSNVICQSDPQLRAREARFPTGRGPLVYHRSSRQSQRSYGWTLVLSELTTPSLSI